MQQSSSSPPPSAPQHQVDPSLTVGGFYEVLPEWTPPSWHNPMAGAPAFDAHDREQRARGDEPHLLQVPWSPSALIQAASLWLSLTAIIRSDAATLAVEDSWAGVADRVHPDERGVSAREYLGDDGIALIEHFWDVIAPLRACEPSRSIAHCEGCGHWWYVPGKAKAPSACVMQRGCRGVVHKAFKVVSATEARRLAEQKAKRKGS